MDFEIYPKVGLGHIKFGMTSSEVDSFDHVYGRADSVRPPTYSFSDEEIESMRAQLGEDGLKALLDAMDAEREYNRNLITQFRSNSSLKFSFQRDALSEIQVSRDIAALSFAGEKFFHVSPLNFLAALERTNGAPPLVKGPDCVFENLCVYVWAAFKILRSGAVRFFREDEDEAQDKSVMLTAAPRNEREDFSGHVPVSFIR